MAGLHMHGSLEGLDGGDMDPVELIEEIEFCEREISSPIPSSNMSS
jgi:hypothetical protein